MIFLPTDIQIPSTSEEKSEVRSSCDVVSSNFLSVLQTTVPIAPSQSATAIGSTGAIRVQYWPEEVFQT